jgi:dynein heavy chain
VHACVIYDFIRNYSDCFQLLVAAMGPPGGGSNEISGRFTRHMFTVCIDSFEDKTLDKIFSPIMDWHFAKGFDANIARLSKVSTGNVLC